MLQEWKIIDEDYLNYLREKGDERIPFSDYGCDKVKPFFGPLFQVGGLYYVTQISHIQPRHLKMKTDVDFIKLFNPADGTLIAVINLNYMFPVPVDCMRKLNYQTIEETRDFEQYDDKIKYIQLLKRELYIIRGFSLQNNAKKIYENRYVNPESFLAKRCLDYKELEKLALAYQKKHLTTQKKEEPFPNKFFGSSNYGIIGK
jgi:protein AbiQ